MNLDLLRLPNGEVNAVYILANAKLLLEANELSDSIRLFGTLVSHPKYGSYAHYGIGLCFYKVGDFKKAKTAFRNALTFSRKSFIAIDLVKAILASGDCVEAERLSLEFGKEFSVETESTKIFLDLYRQALKDNSSRSKITL